ncbi:hypothetical protein R2217_000789 [Cronobacter turicensis]|nr:hypothetical protein [Cronobacter turicensis]ELQ6074679.1 hypothetical protein [Cronobacter turicensis]ELQ6183735.1 hypothetical protein [Cronobacter turicensis]ELQ6234681.1 hypothetical protein [Cronobacter turicensis]ELQ6238561.1 hypothetical protein [Cronobacter turicensis]
MEGFLRGKCLPGDLLGNETNAQYLVRKFTELHDRIEVTTAALREKTKRCEQMAAENAALMGWARDRAVCDDRLEQQNYTVLKIDWRQRSLREIETPATDAFLREVRAQGVEALRDSIAEIEVRPESTVDLHHYCTDFAAELRQGGAA